MRIEQQNYNEERSILIAMIVDKAVLARISTRWTDELFRSPWANRVGKWCVNFYRRHGKAPGPHIQVIYESWASRAKNRELAEPVAQFLEELSNQYVKLRNQSNSDFLIDTAGQYFNRVRLEKLAEQIQEEVEDGKVEEAESLVQIHSRVNLGVGEIISVFEDEQMIRQAFEQNHQPIITYRDGLGKFFGDRLERDGLIAFMGPEKRGKTFWLLDMAFRGVLQKRRVAFFEVGDLSRDQIMRRFMVRVARHPMRAERVEYPLSLKIAKIGNEVRPRIQMKYKDFKTPLNPGIALKACREFLQGIKMKSLLRLSCHYNDTVTVLDIRNMLEEWTRDGWVPDVVVIDYADILNMDLYGKEGRDRIDRTWKQLRRLSQELHCLVVTATQSDAASYDVRTMGQRHFSEDKRKHAHVTGMVGLNQTPMEKEQGIMRLNWVDLREAKYSGRRCCYVATCFSLANMAVCSYF